MFFWVVVYGGGRKNVHGGRVNKTSDIIKYEKYIVNGGRGVIKWKISILIFFNYIYRMFGRYTHGKNDSGIIFEN